MNKENIIDEPAFPAYDHSEKIFTDGMTLRDYFAAKAMPIAMQIEKENTDKEMGAEWLWGIDDAHYIATLAYSLADAMLKARNE